MTTIVKHVIFYAMHFVFLVHLTDGVDPRYLQVRSAAGIMVEVTQKGMDYFSSIAAKSIGVILDNMTMPSQSGEGWATSSIKLAKIEQPVLVKSKFLPDSEVVRVVVGVKKATVTGKYEASTFFYTSKGKFIAQAINVTTVLLLSVQPRGDAFLVNVTACNATIQRIVLGFDSSAANSLRGLISEYIAEDTNTALCATAVTSIEFYQKEILSYVNHAGTGGAPAGGNQSSLDDFCHSPSSGGHVISPQSVPFMRPNVSNLLFNQASLNLSMTRAPIVRPNSVVAFFDAGFLLPLPPAPGVAPFTPAMKTYAFPVIDAPTTGFMAKIAISENLPMNFLHTIFQRKFVKIEKRISSEKLPADLRSIFRLVCPGCSLKLQAEPLEAPTVAIKEAGFLLTIVAKVQSEITGLFSNFRLFDGSVRMKVLVAPVLRAETNRMVGKVDLQSLTIDLSNRGLGFIMSFFVGEIMQSLKSELIPKHIWPAVEAHLRAAVGDAMSRRGGGGIPLPVICGMELLNPVITLIDGICLIETDVKYESGPAFIGKLKALLGN